MASARRRAHRAPLSVIFVAACALLVIKHHSTTDFTLPPQSRSWQTVAASHCPSATPLAAAAGLLIALIGGVDPAFANAPGRWNYVEKGADWGAEFPNCDGSAQTPIDLKASDVSATGAESLIKRLFYVPHDTEVFNNGGKNLQANGNFGYFKLPDGDYEAKQFHFHFPAEHKVDGRLADGEMHIVHQKKGSSGTNDLAVVGILIKQEPASEGPEGVVFSKVGFGGELPASEGGKIGVEKLDLGKAFASQFGSGFYHYRGSLTTPPCSETVHWYVLKRSAPMSKKMIQSFTTRFPKNNRVTLPLNGRKLYASILDLPGEY